jgi:ring-1,2-phenylacetyl-CoA epoxidase subunit PaaE
MSSNFNSLRVIEKINETVDSSSFLLEIPESIKDSYAYKAGQYLTINVVVNGEELRRAYSIFTSPSENKFGFTVKRVAKGKVSNYLIDKLYEGDSIDVMAPEGKFVLEPNVDLGRDHYFIAGGSGITPIMSMIMTVLEEEPKSTAYLIYGNRNENNIIFKSKLDQLEEKYKNQFVASHVISQPTKEKSGGLKGLFSKGKVSWDGITGRIDKKCLLTFMDENKSKSNNNYYYLCGPGGLIDTAEAYLKESGVDSSKIKREYFTSADAVPNPSGASSSDAKVSVSLNGEKFEINVPKDKTILEALLDEGKDAPYSCTSGACSTCIAKVKEGSVEMDACFALDEDEIQSGYILTCQARATTPALDIDFDA